MKFLRSRTLSNQYFVVQVSGQNVAFERGDSSRTQWLKMWISYGRHQWQVGVPHRQPSATCADEIVHKGCHWLAIMSIPPLSNGWHSSWSSSITIYEVKCLIFMCFKCGPHYAIGWWKRVPYNCSGKTSIPFFMNDLHDSIIRCELVKQILYIDI